MFFNKKKNIYWPLIIMIVFLLFCFFSPLVAGAKPNLVGTIDTAAKGIYGAQTVETSFTKQLGQYIQVILAFLGVILTVIIVYAGILWMTAGGNSEQVDKAKGWLKNGIIGLVLVLSAYAIASYAINKITEPVGSPSGGSGQI